MRNMGCATSKKATQDVVAVTEPSEVSPTVPSLSNSKESKRSIRGSIETRLSMEDKLGHASHLIDGIMSVALPLIRHIVSQKVVEMGMVLKHEIKVESFDLDEMPFEFFDVKADAIHVVNHEQLQQDMREMSHFKWPQRCLEKMLSPFNDGECELLIVDLIGAHVSITIAEDFEIALPIGEQLTVELGAGGKIRKGNIKLEVPQLRVWFDVGAMTVRELVRTLAP